MTSLDRDFYAAIGPEFGPASDWGEITAREAVTLATERATPELPPIPPEGQTTVNELLDYVRRRAPFKGATDPYNGGREPYLTQSEMRASYGAKHAAPDWVSRKAFVDNEPDPLKDAYHARHAVPHDNVLHPECEHFPQCTLHYGPCNYPSKES